MTLPELIAAGLVLGGTAFFVAGTVGLLRFPDSFTRLHALVKADNLGLGLVAAGLAVAAGSWAAACKLALVWLLVLLSSATTSHLIAQAALRQPPSPPEAS
jgi:multicomponent Na+:H+ antiporter subunit G